MRHQTTDRYPIGSTPMTSTYELSYIETLFSRTWMYTYPGVPLEQQYHLGNYRADYLHIPSMTIIELDGQTHGSPTSIAADRKRDRDTNSWGFYTLRFGGKEVLSDVTTVITEVHKVIQDRLEGKPPISPPESTPRRVIRYEQRDSEEQWEYEVDGAEQLALEAEEQRELAEYMAIYELEECCY